MTRLERLSHILGVVFDPRFWVRLYDVSDVWSDKLEKLMDDKTPIDVSHSGYTFSFSGSREIWIENWPYAFGYPYATSIRILPRRRTAIRLRKYIQEYWL